MPEVTFIDEKLIKRAKDRSEIIRNIEKAYKYYITTLKQENFILPFNKEAEYRVKVIAGKVLSFHAYTGDLEINKMLIKDRLYYFRKPLICRDFSIYACYNNTGSLIYFYSNPVFGFHYLDIDYLTGERKICTGDLCLKNINSLAELKERGRRLFDALRVCNTNSLGSIFLPAKDKMIIDILKENPNYEDELLELKIIRPFNLGGE
jgi:hypothetical protein